MKIAKSKKIPGLLHIQLDIVDDARGWFKENFQEVKLLEAGFPRGFEVVQNNISFNEPQGVTRGIHAEPWDKYISLAYGKIFVAFVDLRDGDNFGSLETFEIGINEAVFLPQGVGNSFQTLVPNTAYTYLVNDYWSADKTYTMVNLADPSLAIEWPIELSKAAISEKDKNHPYLAEVIPMEV